MDHGTCEIVEDLDPCGKPNTKHGVCVQHFLRLLKTGVATRRELILKQLPTGTANECWLWGGRTNKDGYGVLHVRGASSGLAHRMAYELLVDAIPGDMTIDHMCHRAESCEGGKACRHRKCCNPAHLKIAARGPNALRGNSLAGTNSRKTSCDSGHEYTEENTYWGASSRTGSTSGWFPPTGRWCHRS